MWPYSDYARYLLKAVVGTVASYQKSCCGIVCVVEINLLDSPFYLKAVESAEGLADSTARCVVFTTSDAVRIIMYISRVRDIPVPFVGKGCTNHKQSLSATCTLISDVLEYLIETKSCRTCFQGASASTTLTCSVLIEPVSNMLARQTDKASGHGYAYTCNCHYLGCRSTTSQACFR